MTFLQIASLVSLSLVFSACEKRSSESLTTPTTASSAPSAAVKTSGPTAERGKTIYQTQCTACHNSDPRKPGALGPEVFGSSKELLEARILKADYPPGYQPKRNTHTMAPLPHLKKEIDSIHAYLNSNP
jgi:mono/diheme cytochrome c family protein